MLDFPNQRFGHYYLLDPIARGQDTVLYRAQEGQSVQLVALKIFERPSSSSALRLSRFYRDIEIVHALDHPGILPLHDVGEAEGHPYISMPLCDGTGITPLLRRPTLPDTKEALELTIGLARVLETAHKKNLLHRNLKPSNILFHDGRYKLSDFGIAFLRDLPRPESPTPFAALLYQAPEQLLGLEVDRRTDIFALAVLLYQMLAGVHPFEAAYTHKASPDALEPPSPPSRYNNKVPAMLDRALAQALSRDPGDRPADCNTFAATLERILSLIPSPVPAKRSKVRDTPIVDQPSNIITPLFPSPAKSPERERLEATAPSPATLTETRPNRPVYPWAVSKNKRPPWTDVLASASPDGQETAAGQTSNFKSWQINGVIGRPDALPDQGRSTLDSPSGPQEETATWTPERDDLQAWPWVPGAIGPSIQQPVMRRLIPRKAPPSALPPHIVPESPWSGEFPLHTSYPSPSQDPELVALFNANRGANVPLPPVFHTEPDTRSSRRWVVVFGLFIAVVVSFVYFYNFEFVARDLMLPAADNSTSLSRPQETSNTHTKSEARDSGPESANPFSRDSIASPSSTFPSETRDASQGWPAGQGTIPSSPQGQSAPSNPAGATYHIDSKSEGNSNGY